MNCSALSAGRALARQRPEALTEAEWQRIVVTDIAEPAGWRRYHTYDSRRSDSGFPDLVLVRDGRLIFVELKSQKGRSTPAQREWLRELGACLGVEVFLWRPSDVTEVERVLR